MLCGTEYTAVAGEITLLTEISIAKNIPATSNFSIRIIPFASSLGYEGKLNANENLEQLFMDVVKSNHREG